jgi:hypothetical protein
MTYYQAKTWQKILEKLDTVFVWDLQSRIQKSKKRINREIFVTAATT